MHCAGLEISHFLPGQSRSASTTFVFDVKVEGWLGLQRALRGAQIGTAVVFSSIAGRFGNAGQTDYAAANDLLCKSISNLRRAAPGTRGVAIDWTAWADIGMREPRLDPEDDGDGWHRHVAARVRRARGQARTHGRGGWRRGAGRGSSVSSRRSVTPPAASMRTLPVRRRPPRRDR